MSKDRKRQMIWYQPDDSEAVSRHLGKMARKGWLLEKVDNLFYIYRRSEPSETRYTVTFFPDASYFDPRLIEGQEIYVEYCRAAGWELAASYGPIQYFRTADPDAPPIETDETVKLASIRRTMRKSFVLSHALLLLISVMTFALNPYDAAVFFYSNHLLSFTLLMLGASFFSAGMLGDYLIWILRSWYAVKHGGSCKKPHTRFRLGLSIFMMAVCAATVIGYMLDDAWMRGVEVIYLTGYAGLMVLARWVLQKLKAGSTGRNTARAAYFTFAIIAAPIIGFVTSFLIFFLSDAGLIRMNREPAETYVYTSPDGSLNFSQNVYYDTLPITLEDLGYTVTPDDHCSYEEGGGNILSWRYTGSITKER